MTDHTDEFRASTHTLVGGRRHMPPPPPPSSVAAREHADAAALVQQCYSEFSDASTRPTVSRDELEALAACVRDAVDRAIATAPAAILERYSPLERVLGAAFGAKSRSSEAIAHFRTIVVGVDSTLRRAATRADEVRAITRELRETSVLLECVGAEVARSNAPLEQFDAQTIDSARDIEIGTLRVAARVGEQRGDSAISTSRWLLFSLVFAVLLYTLASATQL